MESIQGGVGTNGKLSCDLGLIAVELDGNRRDCNTIEKQRGGVIAGELEGSWRAGGQQEGLQYNGEAAG